MWIEKHKPRRFDEIVSNNRLIEELKGYGWDKPLILYGATGAGKSMFVGVIANEFNFDLVEIDDQNIADAVSISQTGGIFSNKKLIVIDQVEAIKDIREVTKLVKETKNPTILLTCDLKSKRLRTIKKYCKSLGLRKLQTASMATILSIICNKEGVSSGRDVLLKIAENAGGDVRSAINDLENIAKGRDRITGENLDVLERRDRTTDIFKVLSLILAKRDFNEAVKSTWNLGEQPRDLIQWIDENLPRVYTEINDLGRAYYYLSRADIFLGRIMIRQYWGFLRYSTPLMTGGVNISKGDKINFARYSFPSYFSALGRTKKERRLKGSIGVKMASKLHVSKKVFAREYIPLLRILLSSSKVGEDELIQEYKLDADEIEYLRG